jgi:hypothetical protein
MGFEEGEENLLGEPNKEKRRWVEIDNGGVVSPEWTGVEMF